MRRRQKRARMKGMNAKRPAVFLTIALLFFGAQKPRAQAPNFEPRFESDGRLDAPIFELPQIDAQKFARAALVASGADEGRTERHLKALDALWAELSQRLDGIGMEEGAEKILSFMYEKILRKYNFDQTRVDLTMDTGVYNCVSSSILFMYFCKRADIPVCAVETPRHAFCMIFAENGAIDVETTNPYGVNPGKTRGQDLGGGKTQWITVPAKDYAGRHQVDDRRAIGMVYNNRIVQLQKKRLNAQSVGLAIDAYQVQGKSVLARSDLELCVGNAASDLISGGREQEAIDFLKGAEERFGPCDNWSKKIQTAFHNLLLKKANSLPYKEALAELDANKENLLPRDYAELKEYVYLLNSQKAAQKHDWPAAIERAKVGLEEFPQSKRLLNFKNAFTQNWAADFHNAAADLYNAGKKEEAVAKIKEGLAALPQNKILLSDLEKMSK